MGERGGWGVGVDADEDSPIFYFILLLCLVGPFFFFFFTSQGGAGRQLRLSHTAGRIQIIVSCFLRTSFLFRLYFLPGVGEGKGNETWAGGWSS